MDTLETFETIKPNSTKGKLVFNKSDLTIRVKEWEKNNLMGDYQGCIVADFKSSLGITWQDVENGCLDKNNPMSYPNGFGGRQHAYNEVLANAQSICDTMNKVRGY